MRQYYIYDGQMRKGPFELEQLKSQPLNKETPVWYEGLKDWTRAANIDELEKLFIIASPRMPPVFPKTTQKNIPGRNEILSSFSDATELYPEKKRRPFLKIFISIIIIAAVIMAILFYKKIIPATIITYMLNR